MGVLMPLPPGRDRSYYEGDAAPGSCRRTEALFPYRAGLWRQDDVQVGLGEAVDAQRRPDEGIRLAHPARAEQPAPLGRLECRPRRRLPAREIRRAREARRARHPPAARVPVPGPGLLPEAVARRRNEQPEELVHAHDIDAGREAGGLAERIRAREIRGFRDESPRVHRAEVRELDLRVAVFPGPPGKAREVLAPVDVAVGEPLPAVPPAPHRLVEVAELVRMNERRLGAQPEDEREEERPPPPGTGPRRARPGGDGEERVERQEVALADVQSREDGEDAVREGEDGEADGEERVARQGSARRDRRQPE